MKRLLKYRLQITFSLFMWIGLTVSGDVTTMSYEEYVAYNQSIADSLNHTPITGSRIWGIADSISADENWEPPSDNVKVDNGIIIDTTRLVGRIGIISGVSSRGSKTYTIPITPTTNSETGMIPRISLDYDSHRFKSSTIGIGWRLGGIPCITRTSKSHVYDNKNRGIRLDIDDAFELDGERLIEESRTSTEINYVTFQGNIRAKANIINNVIKNFEVWYPDGRKGLFGILNDSTNRIEYPVTEIKDLHGNKLRYNYHDQGNHLLIDSICSDVGIGIKFDYSKTDGYWHEPQQYAGGKKVSYDYRLTHITTYYDNHKQRKYTLGQSYSENKRLQLSWISCEANNKYLPDIKFDYGTTVKYHTKIKTINKGLLEYYATSHIATLTTVIGDIDKYGEQGLVVYPKRDSYWKLAREILPEPGEMITGVDIGEYINTYSGDEKAFVYTGLRSATTDTVGKIRLGAGFVDLLTADVYGRLQEEIIKVNHNINSDGKEEIKFEVYRRGALSQLEMIASHNYECGTAPIGLSGKATVKPRKFLKGDFTGDGKEQIYVVSTSEYISPVARLSAPTQTFIVELDSGTKSSINGGFSVYTSYRSENNRELEEIEEQSDKLIVVDVDNDGKDEICHIGINSTQIYSIDKLSTGWQSTLLSTYQDVNRQTLAKNSYLFGDFNGDGIFDIMIYDDTTEAVIHYGDGIGGFNKSEMDNECYYYQTADFNYDGKTDLIAFPNDYLGFKVYDIVEKETGEGSKTYYNTIGKYELSSEEYDSIGFNQILFPMQINTQFHSGGFVGLNINTGRLTKYMPEYDIRIENLLTGMTDGYGIVEENGYRNLYGNQAGFYTQTETMLYPYNKIDHGITLLSTAKRYVGGELFASDKYSYTDAVVNMQGLGFCGFSTVIHTDIKDRDVISRYSPADYGVLLSELTPTRQIQRQYDISHPIINAENNCKTLQINISSEEETNNLTGITSATTYEYDNYGYPTRITKNWSDGYLTDTQVQYRHKTSSSDGYNLGFVSRKINRVQKGSSVVTDEMIVESDTLRQPLRVKYLKNTRPVSYHRYLYNSKGLLTQEGISKYTSSIIRTTRYAYNTKGELTLTISPDGLYNRFTYDNNGNLSSKTDEFDILTTYEYDHIGNLVSQTRGDVQININRKWDVGQYQIYSETTESTMAPMTVITKDAFNREVRRADMRYNGKLRKIDICYDQISGLPIRKSLPYTDEDVSGWEIYEYDIFDRLISAVSPSNNITHSYQGMSITTTSNGITTTKVSDSQGNVIKVQDSTGSVEFTLDADGLPTKITSPGGVATTIGYDLLRRRTSMNDPSTGLITWTYDTEGRVAKETLADGKYIEYSYDDEQIKQISTPETDIYYYYNDQLQPTTIIYNNGSMQYAYYEDGRIAAELQTNYGKEFGKIYDYDGGKVSSVWYESTSKGVFGTEHFTYSNGYLNKRVFETPDSVAYTTWELLEENAMGMPTKTHTDKVYRETDYNLAGLPVHQVGYVRRPALPGEGMNPIIPPITPIVPTPGIGPDTAETDIQSSGVGEIITIDIPMQDMTYQWSMPGRRLMSRRDNSREIDTEFFGYDAMNRLICHDSKDVSYSASGNIINREEVGTYSYANSRPYAVESIDLADTAEEPTAFAITYNSFRLPVSIVSADSTLQVRYNYAHQGNRIRTEVQTGNQTDVTYHFLGCYDETDDGTCRLWLGGNDYYDATMLLQRTAVADTATDKAYYFLRDHLGSITHIIDTSLSDDEKLVQELSYDAWGRLRDPETRELYRLEEEPTPMFGRGFTGHEHIAGFRLVNMNARLYDPMTGRMLSPDPIVQSPYFSQNHNRHSYCLNNPLAFTDPTGLKIVVSNIDRISYTGGMDYEGEDEIVSSIVEVLNLIYKYGGKTLLNDLIEDDDIYVYTTTNKYNPYTSQLDDGVYIYINNLLKDDSLFFAIAHESMHAAQFCNGQGGATIFNEIEAYVFENYVAMDRLYSDFNYYGNPTIGFKSTGVGKLYEFAFNQLVDGYNWTLMQIAVYTFKLGSGANITGLYNNYRLYGGNPFRLNSMIQKYMK